MQETAQRSAVLRTPLYISCVFFYLPKEKKAQFTGKKKKTDLVKENTERVWGVKLNFTKGPMRVVVALKESAVNIFNLSHC